MKQKYKKRSSIFKIITLTLMAAIIVFLGKSNLVESNNKDKYLDSSNQESSQAIDAVLDKLYSSNVILLSLSRDKPLLDKNSEDKIYPASLTKIMTTIVAIEALSDLDMKIKLTNVTFDSLYASNASMAGFSPGEEVRAMDLLYGVMLPSGAEACIALADYIAGSEQDFVGIMNKKASNLGLSNTHFINTTGLHDENHYTSVKDLATLLSYALENSIFREIFTTSRHSTQPTNKSLGITFHSTMFKKLKEKSIEGGEILGGKTGYTSEAGLCLASLAVVNDEEYILITVGAKGDGSTEQFNISDALLIYNRISKLSS